MYKLYSTLTGHYSIRPHIRLMFAIPPMFENTGILAQEILKGLYDRDWEWQHYEIGGDAPEKIRYIMGNDPILSIEWF